jgi:glucose-6-phosphate 1-dehydrogenase
MIIFGLTGDLAHRKLLPALYNLCVGRLWPSNFSVVGVARRPFSDEETRAQIKESVEKFSRNKPSQRPSIWESFAQGIFYVATDFDNVQGYKALRRRSTR